MTPTHDPADVPTWPRYDLTVHDDGRIVSSGPMTPKSGHSDRASAVATVAGAADRLGRPVRARATEPDGTVWQLIISPGGEVSEAPGEGPHTRAPKKSHAKRKVKGVLPSSATPAAVTRAGQPGEPEGSESYAGPLSQVWEHLEAGRADQAIALAAGLDEQAAGVHGFSHPDALRIREAHARATALAGDAAGGIRLYRDVAERWYYRGDGERAEEVAGRAEMLWMQIVHVDQALSAGVDVIRLRNQIPGRSGEALTAVLEHWVWLEARAAAEKDAGERGPGVSPTPHGSAPVATWERPAVQPEQQAELRGPGRF